MRKFYLLLCIFSSLLFMGCNQTDNVNLSQWSKVCIENNCFDIKVADSDQERQKWLMNVENMPELSWMLFVFQNTWVYSFWMKNTLIPLDMIWIDENGKIVYIKENAQPCKTAWCETFDPKVSAKYVLEINGWLCQKLGIVTWKIVQITQK